jgi:catechol 2,3-dioxygenase-like lactoylglutathione lyase family enzyme
MAVQRMDNVGIVVEDLDAAIDFFVALGLELEGRAPVEGAWADGVTGLRGMRVEIAMLRTPDGHGRLELSRFLAPAVVADHRRAPVNALGYLRVMFAVDDLDETLARLVACGAELVGEVARYRDAYRLCYVRGPEGILVGLAQALNVAPAARTEPVDVAIPILPCRSVAATVGFYARLGFEGGAHASDARYAILHRGPLELHFFTHEALVPAESSAGCYLRVSDVEAVHRAFAAADLPRAGIPRMDALEDKPWGMREFAVVDPDGNLVRIGQVLDG